MAVKVGKQNRLCDVAEWNNEAHGGVDFQLTQILTG